MPDAVRRRFMPLPLVVVLALSAVEGFAWAEGARVDTPVAGVPAESRLAHTAGAGAGTQLQAPGAPGRLATGTGHAETARGRLTMGESPQIPWARIASGLAVIAALILGGTWLLRKLHGGLPVGRRGYLQVLETQPVGAKINLLLVRVAGKVVLLAASGDQVAAVCEFEADKLPEPAAAGCAMGGATFKGVLKKLVGARN